MLQTGKEGGHLEGAGFLDKGAVRRPAVALVFAPLHTLAHDFVLLLYADLAQAAASHLSREPQTGRTRRPGANPRHSNPTFL